MRLALRTAAAGFLGDLGDLLFAPRCPACGERAEPGAGRGLCPACSRDLRRHEEERCPGCAVAAASGPTDFCPSCRGRLAFDGVFAFGPYAGTARALVHRFKYSADFSAGRFLGELLTGRLRGALPAVDLLVPVPLHRRRLRERGFNQAAFLARRIGKAAALPVDAAALRRSLPTRHLAGLGREERAREVRDAFAVRRSGRFAGMRVLLVDDVLTTGATADGCCRALKADGASWVGVAVAARVLPGL